MHAQAPAGAFWCLAFLWLISIFDNSSNLANQAIWWIVYSHNMADGNGEDFKDCHSEGEEDKDAGEEDSVDVAFIDKALLGVYDEEEAKEQILSNYLNYNAAH